jgi:hypothetical protein
MSGMPLVPVAGPSDLPQLRDWMVSHFKQGGDLCQLDGTFISSALKAAQLWWVEEETCHLLADSAPTWPDDAKLDVLDIPAVAGLAVLAHDIVGTDANPGVTSTVRLSALLWGPVSVLNDDGTWKVGIGIAMFTRLDLHQGLSRDDLLRGGVSLMAAMPKGGALNVNTSGDVITTFDDVTLGTLFAYVGRTDWLSDEDVTVCNPLNDRGVNDTTVRSMTEDRKLLAALWAITKTPIISMVSSRPPRHVARRSEREGRHANVKILRLGGEHRGHVSALDSATRDWKHSWIVRPHWRWQAHGPGRAERKLILVGPYKKGPEDKPLIGSERVWRVVPPPIKGV